MLRTEQSQENPTILAFSGADAASIFGQVSANKVGAKARKQSQNKALQTVAVLQTTLELEPLLRLFSREVSSTIPHCGIRYRNKGSDADVLIGRVAKHACQFHLIVERSELGEISFMRGKPFTPKESAQLEFLLSSLVYPLRNALQYQTAFRASMTDPLTGGFNRLVMESALRHEMGLFNRYQTPLSLLVMDIDCFKTINDEHGHKAGDCVIKAVAEVVSSCLRESDIFSRYGGDEFTILLSNTRLRGALKLAEHVRGAIENLQTVCEGKNIAITVSIGVASLNKSDKNKDLFHRADKALLKAKRQGRNQIRAAASR